LIILLRAAQLSTLVACCHQRRAQSSRRSKWEGWHHVSVKRKHSGYSGGRPCRWLAGKIVQGTGFGLVGDLAIGIVGAFIASWLLPRLGIGLGIDPSDHQLHHRRYPFARDRAASEARRPMVAARQSRTFR
jgi:hypothetical protein